ncbi:ABC-type transporter, integral membrane subunit [Thermodesulfobium narugense DSM 14796]|uniref:ABC-type transporter, integral membrane subunit n=1 Tax=Thermodesulfobium narugense DSM 14796 TaxID=747365 RepID=M1E9A3_9BACT|nr:iron ABC transporter permease [Thermodesulfobium narugense]AEE14999.1 ABC-type transporter, integral membrane subunit [Thermodesulfobium narugense DSM 14796]
MDKKDILKNYKSYYKKKFFILIFLFSISLFFIIFSAKIGTFNLSFSDIILSFFNPNSREASILFNVRLPRIASSFVAGFGLAIAGCVMQNVLRNPLASPFTLGVSQGAAFGACVGIVLLGQGSLGTNIIINNPYFVTVCAFFGSLLSTFTIVFLSKFKGFSPESIVLSGVALGALFSAMIIMLQYFSNEVAVTSMVFWTFGDVGRAYWNEILIMTIVIALSFVYFLLNSLNYNAMQIGDESAKGLGIDVDKIRFVSMIVSSLITAVIVSFLGIIGFVGLVAPQAMRRMIDFDHRFILPASAFMGAILLIIADIVSRTILSPVILPIGAVTSFLGAPFFIYILYLKGKIK